MTGTRAPSPSKSCAISRKICKEGEENEQRKGVSASGVLSDRPCFFSLHNGSLYNLFIYQWRANTSHCNLTRKQARASGLLDLLLRELGEVFRLDDDGNADLAVAEQLEVPLRYQVDDGGLAGFGRLGGLVNALPGDVEELVDVDRGRVLPVLQLMELTHADLTEVTRVILVEVDAMVVLSTGITATTGMLTMLADTAVSHLDMTALLAGMVEAGGHVE